MSIESQFNPPDWVYADQGKPPEHRILNVRMEEMFFYIGAISSEWAHVERALNMVVYTMLAANNLDRPNGVPIADAVLEAHRNFSGRVKLARNLSMVVLVRQEPLREKLLFWLTRAERVSQHRNAIIHGTVVSHQQNQSVTQIREVENALFVSDLVSTKSFRAFPQKTGRQINFEKTNSPSYNLDALKGVLEAVRQVGGQILFLCGDEYMQGLSRGEILPSQPGNLKGDDQGPHQPND